MDSEKMEAIDFKRRRFMTASAAALCVVSTSCLASIGSVYAAGENGEVTWTGLDAPRGQNPLPPGLPPGFPKELFDDTALIPTKVFDNLYCIGSRSVVAWALTTSEGIIIIDAMWDDRDGKLIIDGIEQLGLNPADIKYVLLTHGHGDHYGGAQYIKEHSNAEILLGKTDIGFMRTVSSGANGPRSRKPSVVTAMSDGDQITLGDTTVTVFDTPGHTPGCMSFIFPVKQSGKTYVAAQWGGTGAPSKLEDCLTYQKSIDYFEKQANAAHAAVKINAHLFEADGYAQLDAVRNLNPGSPNPWVIGEEGLSSYFDGLRKMIGGAIARINNRPQRG